MDVALELAESIKCYKKASDDIQIKELTRELGIEDDPVVHGLIVRCKPGWQLVLSLLLLWERKVGSDGATKQKLRKVLLRLHYVIQSLN